MLCKQITCTHGPMTGRQSKLKEFPLDREDHLYNMPEKGLIREMNHLLNTVNNITGDRPV